MKTAIYEATVAREGDEVVLRMNSRTAELLRDTLAADSNGEYGDVALDNWEPGCWDPNSGTAVDPALQELAAELSVLR